MRTPISPAFAYDGMVEPSSEGAVLGAATSLFTENLSLGFLPDIDNSFGAQMLQVTLNPGEIHPGLDTPPDLYLLTVKSAVPLADAILGFYAAAGQENPEINIIHANRELEFLHFAGVNDEAEAAESDRLAELTAGKSHVCVVEQHVASGKTLAYARHLLEKAGVEKASAIRGHGWYHNADAEDVDLAGVTSRWHELMNRIGHAAYQRANQGATINA